MQNNILQSARNILNNVNSVELYRQQTGYLQKLDKLSEEQRRKIIELKNKVNLALNNIEIENTNILNYLQISKAVPRPLETIKQTTRIPKPPATLPKPQIVMPQKRTEILAEQPINKSMLVPDLNSPTFRNLTKDEKKKFVKELKINYEDLKKFIKEHKNNKTGKVQTAFVKEDYTVYKPSSLGEFANKLMKKTADNLISKEPKFFQPMFDRFLTVEMELLSRSYVSMMILFTIIAFPASFLFFLALNFAFKLNILTILLISILCTIATAIGFYFYPASLMSGKSKKIKLELPFALVHMSAVAGSGAQPLSIFELIAESREYPELKKEIKKILNYVNLFGYNLSTALQNVANTTASQELKELLFGMVSTIETGGDLKEYLKGKSDDALNIYRLDRKKQVESLATYSEIYTTLLIAAPLLLLVTLAIINSIGGKIGGFEVKTLAWIGVGGALPLLNFGFMMFISASQKGL